MIILVALGAGALAFSATVALALGRVAASADRQMEQQLRERRALATSAAMYRSYAGLARAQATISWEPSTTVPSSRTSVGTQRLPVSSRTSRRPRV